IPSADLLTPALPREVRLVLDQQSMPAGTLKLELPERSVMENPARSGEILEQLRSSGVDLILDGFGAGYSSIPYLQQVAFDTFKIDR
ncbi:EAL domain-containing protein, partial [Acinetobacter baumannii]